MLKKTITYIDFNDESRTEDFYFHLTKAEVTELEVSEKDGLAATIRIITEEKNFGKLVDIFKKIILLAYGKKTADGGFMKSQELRDSFSHTQAYSDLFMELATDADAAAIFINGIMPKDLKIKQ